MFTRPDDLADAEVAHALRSGWGIEADTITYGAVGFGSHHWFAHAGQDRWFLTVDAFDVREAESDRRRERWDAALATAAALRHQGADYVVAPVASRTGVLAESIKPPYQLAVYPHVEGESGQWGPYGSQDQRFAVVGRLADLHCSNPLDLPLVDDLTIPSRAILETAMHNLDRSWEAGPFGDRARHLLTRYVRPLQTVLARYDEMARSVVCEPERFVITHGEPHPGNVIFTKHGAMLVDWDTAVLAPRERDLWALIGEDDAVTGEYQRRTGVTLDQDTLAVYKLGWDLTEIALYITDFFQPHTDTADTRTGWNGLIEHLDPTRWVLLS